MAKKGPKGPCFALHEDGKVVTITNPREQDLRAQLPPAIYRIEIVTSFFGRQIILHKEELTSERYVDLGGPAGRVMDIARRFFAGEHRANLARHGMLNKVFMLLHGPPGTGKTLVANEVARLAITSGAVVLRVAPRDKDGEGLDNLHEVISAIREIAPDQLVMIQLDDAENIFGYEERLIAMLDGDAQQDNLLWTVTTNFPHVVPERLMGRTRRIQFQFPFGPPSAPMRRRYLEAQGITGTDLEQYVIATRGKTIDQIAGLVNATILFGQPAEEVLEDVEMREKVRASKLDYNAYMENYYGAPEDRNVSAAAAEIEDGYVIDQKSGRKVKKVQEEKKDGIPTVSPLEVLLAAFLASRPDNDPLMAFLRDRPSAPSNGVSKKNAHR